MNRLALLGVALVLLGAGQCSWAAQTGDQKPPPKVELQKLLTNLKSTDEHTKLDAMIRMRPELLRFLQQDSRAECTWEDTLTGLHKLASLLP